MVMTFLEICGVLVYTYVVLIIGAKAGVLITIDELTKRKK